MRAIDPGLPCRGRPPAKGRQVGQCDVSPYRGNTSPRRPLARPTLPLQGREANMYSRAVVRLNGKVRFATKSHGEIPMDGTRHLKLCSLAALGLVLGLGTASAQ